MKILTIGLIFTSMIEVYCTICPADSTILQDQGIFWCVWVTDLTRPLSDIARHCQMSGGIVLVVENDNVQLFLQETLEPVLLCLGITDDIWINYNTTTKASLEGVLLLNTYWGMPPIPPVLECVKAIRPNYLWEDTRCKDKNYGICYKEIDCKSEDSFYVKSYDLCYWLAADRQEYSAKISEDICQSDGGTLAMIPNAEIMAVLVNNTQIREVLSGYDDDCWLGLNDQASEGKFTTMAGKPAPYLDWHDGEPNNFYNIEDCVILVMRYPNGIAMNDAYCKSGAVPLCFKWNVSATPMSPEPMTSITTSTLKTTTPSLTTSDDMTTPNTNSVSSNSTDNQVLCICQREAYNTLYINNTAALDKQLVKLKTEVQVDIKNTSAYKKSLVCATDARPSATNIGITATVIMSGLLGMILFVDVMTMTGSLSRPRTR